MCSVDGEGVGEGVGVSTSVFPFSGAPVGEGEGEARAEEVGVADGVEMGVSGIDSGVADIVASGITSGGIVSAEIVLVKIMSGFKRRSSGLGAGPTCVGRVWAELVASSGGDSWAYIGGGAGRMEIQG